MKPLKEQLLHLNRVEIAERFGVSDRTVVRWLQHHDIFERRGSGKLSLKKAREIRRKHDAGASIKELAEEYDVTFATASRVLHRLTYKDPDFAKVSVIYNPH
jgi:transposase